MNNTEFVKCAEKQIGLPYWWGTFGQIATKSLLEAKRKQYPNYYTATDFESQIGKRTFDCVGLIKYIIWSNAGATEPVYGKGMIDTTANGVHSTAKEKGEISTIPEIPGLYVWMNDHIGIYAGNGYVIEARGHAYGVQKTVLKNRPFTHWGKLPWIIYSTNASTNTDEPKAFTQAEWDAMMQNWLKRHKLEDDLK